MTKLLTIQTLALLLGLVGCATAPAPEEQKGSTESHLDGTDESQPSTTAGTSTTDQPSDEPSTPAGTQAGTQASQDPTKSSNASLMCDPNRCGTDDGVHYWICLPDGTGKVGVRRDACVPPQR